MDRTNLRCRRNRCAFLRRHRAAADDASAEISDDRRDVRGAEFDRCRIEIIRRWTGRPAVAAARVGVFAEARHARAGAAAADGLGDRRIVKARGAQIGSGRRFVPLLLTIGKRAVAFRAAATSPCVEARFYLRFVLARGTGLRRRLPPRGSRALPPSERRARPRRAGQPRRPLLVLLPIAQRVPDGGR